MPDRELSNLDFKGLADAAQHAFKPDFADVLRRAGRRRSTARAMGAAVVAAGVAAGGGSAVLALSGNAGPVDPTPSASVGPWQTVSPDSSRQPAPQPQFTEITPGSYDVTEPDKPLTGMWTELVAGDLNHLYLEYQDCKGKNCTRMLATSADGGRTWRKLRMPAGLRIERGFRSITAVLGTTLVARDSDRVRRPMAQPTYWTSVDGGVTWRQPAVRKVDALPVDWPLVAELDGLAAFDPATGDVVRLAHLSNELKNAAGSVRAPAGGGIWLFSVQTDIPSPFPTGDFVAERWLAAVVSRDGGRTWEKHRMPDAVGRRKDGGWGMSADQIATVDGKTIYAVEKLGDSVRVHVSTDGAATWRTGALVDLDGPMLSLLPTREGAVIIEGATGTFRSTDQGQTFTRVGPSLGSRGHAIPGGYAIPTNNNEYSVWLSSDGSSWRYVGRPEVP